MWGTACSVQLNDISVQAALLGFLLVISALCCRVTCAGKKKEEGPALFLKGDAGELHHAQWAVALVSLHAFISSLVNGQAIERFRWL